MNSTEIQAQLTQAETALKAARTRASEPARNVQVMLERETALVAAERLTERLQAELIAMTTKEHQAKEQEDRAALEAKLEGIRTTHTQTTNDRRALLNQIAQELATSGEREGEAVDTLHKLQLSYENTFLKRFGRWPEDFRDHLRAKPDVELTPEGEIVAFALQLLRNQKSGSGMTLKDVYRRIG